MAPWSEISWMRSPRVATMAMALGLAACSGQVGDSNTTATPPGRDHTGGTGEMPGGAGGTTPSAPGGNSMSAPGGAGGLPTVPGGSTTPAVAAPLPLTMIRLTQSQFTNSLRDVLGAAAPADLSIEEDYIYDGSAAAGAREVTVSRSGVRAYADAAERAAGRAVADPAFRSHLTGCTMPTGPTDATCARAIVTEVGHSLYRRPLDKDELDRWSKVATTAAMQLGDFWKGLQWALAGLLASPNFTHRIEVGHLVGGKLVPTDLELASRLSYLLWDTTPDAALLAAAERNELSQPAGYATQVDRLLGDRTRLSAGLQALGTDLFVLHTVDNVVKDSTKFPADSPDLRVSMRGAALRLLEEVATTDADLLSLFEPGYAFVDKRLAPLIGVSSSSATLTKVNLPASGMRVGILTEPALLTILSRSALTSPTLRGRFVREKLLCSPVPDPPQDVNANLPNTANGQIRRDQLTDHMKNPTCNACHKYMDPIGFGLENFDALGTVQKTDNGAPVVATGDIDGVTFDGPRGLSHLVRTHANTPGCLVRGIFRHVFGAFDAAADQAAVDTLTVGMKDGGNKLLPLLRGMVMSDTFRSATAPQ